MTLALDLAGKTFGRLNVTHRAENGKHNTARWVAICDCGKIKTFSSRALVSGRSKSCGCLRKEITRERTKTHGESYKTNLTAEYSIWNKMRRRCLDLTNKDYKYYGGRGLTISDEWCSYECFLKDMGRKPTGYTLDRIDNNKGYSKDNCRWVTRKEQMRNMRRNVSIEYKDVVYPSISSAIESLQLKISPQTLGKRLLAGWPVESAIEAPIQKVRRKGLYANH